MAKKSDNYRPGAIDVASVRMKNSDQTEVVDLTSLCVFFNIYEDIYNNCMQADFTLIDAQGLFSDFPINGDEVIEVAYKTSSDEIDFTDMVFRIYKVGPREPVTDKSIRYTLYAVSEESILDNVTRVDTVIQDAPISTMVRNVDNQYLKKASVGIDSGMYTQKPDEFSDLLFPNGKNLTVESTLGNQRILPNRLQPLAYINLLASEAEGLNSKSSTFLFYETVDGFRFETLEHMSKQDPIEDYIYVMKNKELNPIQKDKFNEYQKIEDLVVKPIYDNVGKLMNGAFGSKVNYIDPLTKTFRTKEYNYGIEFGKESHTEEFKVINDQFLNRYDVVNSKSITMHSDASQALSKYILSKNPKTTFRRKQNFLSREKTWQLNFESVKINYSIPGDSTLRAGKCVSITLPEASGTKDKLNKDDRYVKGNFIISSLRHHVNLASEKYTTYVECIKDSYSEELTNIPPDSEDWG